ncbi:hypothetical protein A2765_01255 [Candidatus Kaiserbacteria bacterium RIFCSPHIGHO2_01_FULL_56_24]|uniref:Uncharacterized protein n=1 Tax=Candidatus Kaiserbacteria bacterium RIFCSPHIGHO2_01_FULL_56_24 TaxID=1798487 RepID=A0A1F6DG85_9BACT|nr:MAG: hypothetical protein A2765_01255 [Candidatus Kaiserbacteria bacterium RIFCSPHIGHO2_01_FULL_56_24]
MPSEPAGLLPELILAFCGGETAAADAATNRTIRITPTCCSIGAFPLFSAFLPVLRHCITTVVLLYLAEFIAAITRIFIVIIALFHSPLLDPISATWNERVGTGAHPMITLLSTLVAVLEEYIECSRAENISRTRNIEEEIVRAKLLW